MKKILFVLFTLTFYQIYAQINAVTENGDPVLLNSDGTWEYTDKNALTAENELIAENKTLFSKPESSNFLVKSNILNVGGWINAKEWKFTKETDNEDAEYEFKNKSKDIYAMMITEEIEIPLESLVDIAIENGKIIATDMKVVQKEYRTVNDTKVLMLQMSATVYGIKIMYCGYYYSNENGSVQLVTYTSEKLFDERNSDIMNFLNGFVELQ